ncbi:hypothetical protein CLIB1423_12S03422 [[Candida] railenensis]|uniref:PHD-type domain-containing protein n=1 Tax=[Candida] railenensis TaxID=45579 RepID=A0A9P0QSY3_9ASCO|nr:hypothetical protein CLIB1423_12S03422 [[Candida] railenensis]
MEVIDSRSGDETDLPSSALSTDKSFLSDSDVDNKKRSLEEEVVIKNETSGEPSSPKKNSEPSSKKVKLEVDNNILPPIKQEAPKEKKKSYSRRKVEKEKEEPDSHDFSNESEDISKQYKKFKNAPRFNLNSEEVFCICRKPDHGGLLMISCDGCDEWFHFSCMKLNMQYQNLISKFYCKFCSWKEVGQTQWKRKCRLDTCYEPISAEGNSKYCSEKCGIDYIKGKLVTSNGGLSHSTSINSKHDSKSGASNSDVKSSSLTVPEIKSILIYSTNNGTTDDEQYRNLKLLGSKLPQLPEVMAYHSDPSVLSRFPEPLQSEIKLLNEKSSSFQDLLKVYMNRLDLLVKMREKLRIINEKLQERDQTASSKATEAPTGTKSKKGKSSKAKKIEICGYEKIFSADQEEWIRYSETHEDEINALLDNSSLSYDNIHENMRKQIDELVEFYNSKEDELQWFDEKICINDKRKCARHGGWWSLIQDEISNKINEFHSDIRSLEREKQQLLREYSISVFESGSKIPQ